MFETYKNFDYYVFLPEGYREGDKVSLLIDLHGAGRRGKDLPLLVSGGLEKRLEEGKKLSCVVVAPQCFSNTWFDIFEQLQDFVSAMVQKYGTDRETTFLSGTSMGSYAAWQLLCTMPCVCFDALSFVVVAACIGMPHVLRLR